MSCKNCRCAQLMEEARIADRTIELLRAENDELRARMADASDFLYCHAHDEFYYSAFGCPGCEFNREPKS